MKLINSYIQLGDRTLQSCLVAILSNMMVEQYGADFAQWLDCQALMSLDPPYNSHEPLKLQFPQFQ